MLWMVTVAEGLNTTVSTRWTPNPWILQGAYHSGDMGERQVTSPTQRTHTHTQEPNTEPVVLVLWTFFNLSITEWEQNLEWELDTQSKQSDLHLQLAWVVDSSGGHRGVQTVFLPVKDLILDHPGKIKAQCISFSLSDTFASKMAAIQDQYADASIGNVTGSNAVNVFLGIGVAWSIAAIYHYSQGKVFRVDPGTLAFSVTLFTIFAFICIAVLIYRRRPEIGGELGGPKVPKILTSCLFFSLWLMYILFSSLEAYCHIQGFWRFWQMSNKWSGFLIKQVLIKGLQWFQNTFP